jgi:hypothetical protein
VVLREGFDLHFDDDFMEIDMLNKYCEGKGMFVGYQISRPEEEV